MTISTHHHLRNGDFVANAVFAAAAELGVKDLRWFPSASFPCHAGMIEHMDNGVIHHIEGSMNGPLGDYCSRGRMRGMAVLRSHGGRYQAVQDGEVHIDIAVIAAPTADPFGNATGDRGPTACGLLGFALADSEYADHVIVVTDNLVEFPCIPWQIQGNHVDQVVVMDTIGDASKIVSGTTQITKSPDRLLIASVTPAEASYPDAESIEGYYRSLEERIAALPGVAAVGTVSHLPLNHETIPVRYTTPEGEGQPVEDRPSAYTSRAGPAYFEAMGIALREGRVLRAEDRAEGVAAVGVADSLELRGHQIEGFIPGDFLEFARTAGADTFQGLFQARGSVVLHDAR